MRRKQTFDYATKTIMRLVMTLSFFHFTVRWGTGHGIYLQGREVMVQYKCSSFEILTAEAIFLGGGFALCF